MEWSIKPRRLDQPFGSWADDLAAAFVRLEPRRIADQPFEGAISRVDAVPVQISLVTATVLRLASHIALSTDDLCFVNLQLEGLGAPRSAITSRSVRPVTSRLPIRQSRSRLQTATTSSSSALQRVSPRACRTLTELVHSSPRNRALPSEISSRGRDSRA
jgi:hypothetical protein